MSAASASSGVEVVAVEVEGILRFPAVVELDVLLLLMVGGALPRGPVGGCEGGCMLFPSALGPRGAPRIAAGPVGGSLNALGPVGGAWDL